jgi:transcriptional regulator with XRE-family HTH domain
VVYVTAIKRIENPLVASAASSARIRSAAERLGRSMANTRKLQRLTAQQVADRAGVSRGTLRRLEAGETTVGLDVTLSVARVLGMLDRLIDAADPMTTPLGQTVALDRIPQRVRR